MERNTHVELLVAGSALFVSIASFWLAWQQTRAMDAQVEAMTWPYLQFVAGNYDVNAGEAVISLEIENAGVGPTQVVSLVLRYDGEPVTDYRDLLQRCCTTPEEPDTAGRPGITSDPSPRLIPAGESALLFRLRHEEAYADFWKRLDAARWKLSGEACYCSILDECWTTDFENAPQRVEYCEANVASDWRG